MLIQFIIDFPCYSEVIDAFRRRSNYNIATLLLLQIRFRLSSVEVVKIRMSNDMPRTVGFCLFSSVHHLLVFSVAGMVPGFIELDKKKTPLRLAFAAREGVVIVCHRHHKKLIIMVCFVSQKNNEY